MANYDKQVEAAIRATTIHSLTLYSWFGQQSRSLTPVVKNVLTPEHARSYLLFNLQTQLYKNFYCCGFAAPNKPQTNDGPAINLTPFVEALSAANTGRGYSEGGWEVRSIDDDRLVAQRDGLALRIRPEDYLPPPNKLIEPGLRLNLHFPKEFLGMSPGFYMAVSNKEFLPDVSPDLIRFYWHLTPAGAEPLVRQVTTLLNQAALPFRFKILNNPEQFNRCDAAVLYTPKSDYTVVSEIVGQIYSNVVATLKPGIPAFTKLLAPGLGLAEDPGPGESFGLHRCRLLADGLIRAYEQGQTSLAKRLRIVMDRLAEAGISLEKPFLNPGSSDNYDFHPQPAPPVEQAVNVVCPVSETKTRSDEFLRTAHKIGQRLCREAIWHGDRCTWLGVEIGSTGSLPELTGLTYRTLGPDLYNGASGVALFLAELYAATGEAEARRTALGAIRQALARADDIPPALRLGLYTGRPGLALAAARIGVLLAEEKLLKEAAHLVQRPAFELSNEQEFDLLSGRAGAIVALLALQNLLAKPPLLDLAVQLGNLLLQTAERSKGGYSWKAVTFSNQRNLTGFSHGTAGVGFALLELFRTTGDPKYRETAEQAFTYERFWFDAEAGNWPNFHEEAGQRRQLKRPLTFSTYWCHGAPGIALSRLRAYQLLTNQAYKDEAVIALRTTGQVIETWLQSGAGNYSLCHGLAGNSEVLLYGHQVLGQTRKDGVVLAYKVADTGINRYSKYNLAWPCGTHRGETPGLMLGLAGIGYFYLRLFNPTIPSILIFDHNAFNPSDSVSRS